MGTDTLYSRDKVNVLYSHTYGTCFKHNLFIFQKNCKRQRFPLFVLLSIRKVQYTKYKMEASKNNTLENITNKKE